MSAVNLINPSGRIVTVNRVVIEQLKANGLFKDYSKFISGMKGDGDEKKILILHSTENEMFNGLGDAIHALPAIDAKIKEGYEVTVNDNKFRAPIFKSVGAKVKFDNFEDDRKYAESKKADYGMIYCCRHWCLEHEWETEGIPTRTRFQAFADIINTTLGDFEFPFYKQKEPPKREEIILCTQGSSLTRNYPHTEELLTKLQTLGNVTLMGNGGLKTSTFKELASRIYNAKLVVTIDTGILALALALKTPTVALFGGTDEKTIAYQYGAKNLTVIRSQREDSSCMRPCSFEESRGYGNGKCNDRTGDCMAEITVEEIFIKAKEMIN